MKFNRKNYFTFAGLLLGYPKCCIDQFIRRDWKLPLVSHNGFCPCDEHRNADPVELLGRDPAFCPADKMELLERMDSFDFTEAELEAFPEIEEIMAQL
jgi:hypothetical protein